MDTPAWLPYVGVVTGTIGTITGTVGAVLGYKGYRRSQEMKALDLRLTLRKAEVDYRRTVEELPELLRRARASRAEVLGAQGNSKSGAFEAWVEQWQEDLKRAEAMLAALPTAPSDYQGVSYRDLETRLVTLHRERRLADGLRDKYREHLAWDAKQVEEIRADQRSKVLRTLGRP
jgi:hypothetical protein